MSYAPRYSWAHLGSGTPADKYAVATAFDNTVKYQGTFGALKLGASYGADEGRQHDADGRKLAAGLTYESSPLRLVATSERLNGTVCAGRARSHPCPLWRHCLPTHRIAVVEAGLPALQAGARNRNDCATTLGGL